MSLLDVELQTVDLLIRSTAATRLTDAFTLLYVKSEKQLRKLFVFIAYQSPDLQRLPAKEINATVASFKHLQAKHYINGINQIYHKSFSDVFGADYARLKPEIERIRTKVRNKILHGQPTGLSLHEPQLEYEIALVREWITCVFTGFRSEMGFGGFERNTFRKAKAFSRRLKRTFTSSADFSSYLKSL
jgi:hypothetical protein